MATKSNGKPGKDSGEPGKLKEYQPGQAFNGVLSLATAPGWGVRPITSTLGTRPSSSTSEQFRPPFVPDDPAKEAA
jgi:hypothetical protein